MKGSKKFWLSVLAVALLLPALFLVGFTVVIEERLLQSMLRKFNYYLDEKLEI